MEYNVPGRYEVVAVSTSAIGLTAGNIAGSGRATMAILAVEDNAIRIRTDGADPTTAVGFPLASGSILELEGRVVLNNLRMIRQSADASVKVLYFHES